MIDVQTILCVRVYAHTQTVTDTRKVKHLCVCVCVRVLFFYQHSCVCTYVCIRSKISGRLNICVCVRARTFSFIKHLCACACSPPILTYGNPPRGAELIVFRYVFVYVRLCLCVYN